MKKLNPLRRARKTFTSELGDNNSNIEGQDNGNNAWMDSQLNSDVDEDMRYNARYAKVNSDNNRFFDIDDIPIRGPPKLDDAISDTSAPEVLDTAKQLINNEN